MPLVKSRGDKGATTAIAGMLLVNICSDDPQKRTMH